MENNKIKYTIGIDLGTTYSCVGVFKNGKVEIIPNELGKNTTPSIVSFKENKRLIGQEAKNIMTNNFKNTLYDSKRLIGRNFSENVIQENIKLWPFEIEKDNNDKILYVVQYKNEKKKFYPKQISSMILESLKKNASKFLNQEITDAVITVPAHFNNNQREDTIDAGKIAGLNIIKLINEPNAAAIAYGLEKNFNIVKNVLVFDLGGGTLDVTIIEINKKKFNVKAIGGDSHLGGQDFDNELIKFCIQCFKEENGIDIIDNQKAIRRLKNECEKVKINLSSSKESFIDIDSLCQKKNFNLKILRSEFEDICQKLFDKCLNILESTLNESKISKNEIDDIILVGGSSRIPKIQEMISNFFDNKKQLLKVINPDEAIAYGAAIEAGLCNENHSENLANLEIVNVCPLSLGTGVKKGLMSVIIKRNTPIPCEVTKGYITTDDNQEEFTIGIFEGERKFYKDNLLLDRFYINNIRQAPKGEVTVKVTLRIDENSILNVSAYEKGNENNKKQLVIKREIRSDEEIENMIQQSLIMRKDDEKREKIIEEKYQLEKILNEVKNMKVFQKNKNEINEKVNEVKNWIKEHPNENVEVFMNKKSEFNHFISSLKE